MASGRLRSSKKQVIKEDNVSKHGESQGMRPGDVTWVKIEDSKWWPAQVVDEKSISTGNKPKKKRECKTLVRLYGTYEYLYVDFLQCRSEFDDIFKQNTSEIRKKFQETLEALSSRSVDKSETSNLVSGSKESQYTEKKICIHKNNSRKRDSPTNPLEAASEKKTPKRTSVRKKDMSDESRKIPKEMDVSKSDGTDVAPHLFKSPDRSIRQVRLMQKLGLIAPEGSPFSRTLSLK